MSTPTTTWADITAAGGPDKWIAAELRRRGLLDEGTDTARLSDAERKQYKAKREEERRVRRELKKVARAAYKAAHLVHVGAGVFWHDTADVDRFDAPDPAGRLQSNNLPPLADAEAVAKALALPIPRLRWLVYHRDVDSGTHYHRWRIPKRDGRTRLISAPKRDLKNAQKWITRAVTERLPIHGYAHGFVAGRSTGTNAAAHAGARFVVKFDIEDFYPTITFRRVKGLLRKAGYGEQTAAVLALLSTESPRDEMALRGKTYYVATGPRSLPQGAPTSPSITNAICLRLDLRLAGLAKKLGLRYTRYADDLTFSWHAAPDAPEGNLVGRLLKCVELIVTAEGFRVHRKKTRVMRRGSRQKVTGLVVNEAPGRPPARVPREVQRKLRAALHNREQGKPGKGESLAVLRGWAAYIHMTDPARGRAYLDRIAALEGKRNKEETP